MAGGTPPTPFRSAREGRSLPPAAASKIRDAARNLCSMLPVSGRPCCPFRQKLSSRGYKTVRPCGEQPPLKPRAKQKEGSSRSSDMALVHLLYWPSACGGMRVSEEAPNGDQLSVPTLPDTHLAEAPLLTAPSPDPSMQAIAPEKRRDRIVVLGRQRAGKTLYMSMLYWILWRSQGDMAMKAIQGQTHATCMDKLQSLQSGKWPAANFGSYFLDFEVTLKGCTKSLVMLDYPGEVFRRAFITNDTGADVKELLEHIDRAAALILLTDPATVLSNDLMERADDDFGLLKAVERVRSGVGGDRVPVALVLTKYDVRKASVEKRGGPEAFVGKYYAQLVRELRDFRLFTTSACGQQDVNGTAVPLLSRKVQPFGVVEPLRYIMERLSLFDQERSAEELRVLAQKLEQQAEDSERRNFFKVGALTFVIAAAVMGFVVWLIVRQI